MNDEEKWNYIVSLDEEVLHGGVTLSEYISELIRNADVAFVHNAYWASIITSVAAIEGCFKSESFNKSETLRDLIDHSGLDNEEIELLHNLRRYRNKIVHIKDTWDDDFLLSSYEEFSVNEERVAMQALRLLRSVVYSNPWI